jgi:hypothetical protein
MWCREFCMSRFSVELSVLFIGTACAILNNCVSRVIFDAEFEFYIKNYP